MLALTALIASAGEVGDLAGGFAHPPDSARPWVYWFWLDGNITKEGITADLEAMQRVGLGGALWMWGGGVGEGVKGPVQFLSPQWWELMRHTLREADRLGLEIDLTNGSGWSHSGGPWIRPEASMQRLELAREIQWDGAGDKEAVLAEADSKAVVAVVARPMKDDGVDTMRTAGVEVSASSTASGFDLAKALDRDPKTRWISQGAKTGDGPTPARPESVSFAFPQAYAAAGLFVVPFADCGPRQCQMQVSQNGADYQTVCRFELAPAGPQTIPFEAAPARFFRLLISSSYPFQGGESWNVQIAEIQLLQNGEQPLMGTVLESQGMVDLTAKVDASGRLAWQAPPGRWRAQVFVHRSTGDAPHPILPDESGLECDKLSPEAVEANWHGFIGRVLDECAPEARRVIRSVHVDSYEFGVQTWTPRLREEFQRRCGYDLTPYLPVLTGQTVDDPETSARFLWDFERVRADLFAEEIGGHFRALCKREGIALTTEPHLVPHVFDQIQYGGYVSEPVGNFLAERRTGWYAANPPVGPEIHLAKGEASSAYTYGLNGIVRAEAFTGVDHAHAWKETPAYLKTWGDLWFTEGINHFIFHCWAHSPSLVRKPGITLGPWGIHFDRRNTWFDLAGGYLSYLSRCQYLLREGLPVADVCQLTGDGVVAEFPRHPELRANGYDYHGMTSEVLLRDVQTTNGWLILPSGMRYRLLASYSREMRPATLRKLRQLVKGGATLLGVKPEDAPGLVDFPRSRDDVRSLADDLWGSDPEAGRHGRAYGSGKVFWGDHAAAVQGTSGCGVAGYLACPRELEVLREMGEASDFQYGSSGREDSDNMVAYIHRRNPGADWYFVANQAGRQRKENCRFRITGRRPELWDPVRGFMRDLPEYREEGSQTVVPLEFAAGQSFFLVFRKAATKEEVGQRKRTNVESLRTIREVTGPWEVSFDAQWGGPKEPVNFEALIDWSKSPQEGIKFYSGKASYSTEFDLTPDQFGERLYLDLGRVKDLARVSVNGKLLGEVWCEPWRIEIAGAVRSGKNRLELIVANEWVNRLIGDSVLPPEKRVTWTTWNPYKPDSPLLESGLLGPVTLGILQSGD